MPLLAQAALRASLASGALAPLYVLVGDDEAEKSAVAQEFLDSVDEGLRAFNVERLYGADTSVDELSDAAATFPMMVPRRIVVVFAAEGLLVPKRESKAAEEAQERLEAFISSPPDHASVVFVCGEFDRRRRVIKQLIDRAQIVDCGTIADAADAERWVKVRALQAGVPLDAGAVRTLVARVGVDIRRLRAGIDRVALYALGQKSITADDVREAVSAGPDAPEDFGIANAIKSGDARKALAELAAALDAGAPPDFLLGQIRFAAESQTAGRIRAAMDGVFRTNLALRSTGHDPRVMLERLVVELCSSPSSASRPPSHR